MSVEFKPADYDCEQFVDREEELALIDERVKRACRGEPVNEPIVHFHCVPRAGKTWLLNHLAYWYTREPLPTASARKVIVVFVDCADLVDASDVRRRLLEACMAPFMAKATEWRSQLEGVTSIEGFTASLRACGGEFVPLFLIDAADALNADDFAWLEASLFEPLVCADQAVIVVAGHASMPLWKRPETQRRRRDQPLRAFNADETAELKRKRHFAGTVEELYWHAQGHPYLTQLLAETTGPLDDARVSEVIQHVETELLRDIPVERHGVVRILVVLRQFFLDTLRAFLSEMMGADYTERSDAFFLGSFLQEKLHDPDWFIRVSQSVVYRPTQVVRGVLLQRLRLLDPDLYRQGHLVALKVYEQQLERYPQHSARLLREVVYYRTGLGTNSQQPDMDLETQLTRLVARYLTPDYLSTDQAKALEKDLQEDQKLPEKLSCGACYEGIRRQLRQFIQRIS